MKLSDIKGERVLEVIAEIIDPIANIAESDAAKKLFRKEKLPEGMTRSDFMVQRIRASVPALLKDHKQDIITILAVIAGKSYAEYESGMSIASLIRDLTDLISDNAFTELFMHAQTGEQSGSAQESTGEQ